MAVIDRNVYVPAMEGVIYDFTFALGWVAALVLLSVIAA
jgi:hypothetical protein